MYQTVVSSLFTSLVSIANTFLIQQLRHVLHRQLGRLCVDIVQTVDKDTEGRGRIDQWLPRIYNANSSNRSSSGSLSQNDVKVKKGKVVPVGVMMAYRGNGGISPIILNLQVPAALFPGRNSRYPFNRSVG
jgi:hypothetical protein